MDSNPYILPAQRWASRYISKSDLVVEIYAERPKSGAWTAISLFHLSLPKMLSGANAFEISNIVRMNIGGASAGQDVTIVTCPVVTG
jgi:hypothetical protein